MRTGLKEDLERFENALKEVQADINMTYSMNDLLGAEYRNSLYKAKQRITNEIEVIKCKLEELGI